MKRSRTRRFIRKTYDVGQSTIVVVVCVVAVICMFVWLTNNR